jgi:cytochrome c oxidase subunit 2
VAGTDLTILIAYSIAVVLSVAVTLVIWGSTRGRRRPLDTHKLAEFEKRWLSIVATFLVALLAATIWFAPYGQSTPPDAQIVHVTAEQFFWQIEPGKVRAHVPVAFVTRSNDVNHGFAIYKGHEFIAQIQVVPGRSSTLFHTFEEPGHYTILCLEFCGVGHQKMISSIVVTP